MSEPKVHPSGALYAGWWERVAAEIIDGLLLTPLFVAIVVLVEGVRIESVMIALVVILYNGLLDGNERGQTVGKRAMRIRVADDDTGAAIGLGRGFGRALVVAVLQNAGLLIAFAGFLGLLDVLWPLWDSKRQTWHDKAIASVVLKASPAA